MKFLASVTFNLRIKFSNHLRQLDISLTPDLRPEYSGFELRSDDGIYRHFRGLPQFLQGSTEVSRPFLTLLSIQLQGTNSWLKNLVSGRQEQLLSVHGVDSRLSGAGGRVRDQSEVIACRRGQVPKGPCPSRPPTQRLSCVRKWSCHRDDKKDLSKLGDDYGYKAVPLGT